MTSEHKTRTPGACLLLIIASLLAATAGVFHAVWVLFPLLDARATATMMGLELDPEYRVGDWIVLMIATIPVLAIGSALWALRRPRQGAVGEAVAGIAALYLAWFDIGGGFSGMAPAGLLILIALMTCTVIGRFDRSGSPADSGRPWVV